MKIEIADIKKSISEEEKHLEDLLAEKNNINDQLQQLQRDNDVLLKVCTCTNYFFI